MNNGILEVRMDGDEDRRVAVDSRAYPHLDYGYATTIHKAQGTTVDRTFVLASPHFDRHATYVALSRHREAATVFYAAEDFSAGDAIDRQLSFEVRDRFQSILSRARLKELAHDYLYPEVTLPEELARKQSHTLAEIEAIQQNAAERWFAKQQARKAGLSAEDYVADYHRIEQNHGDFRSRQPSQERSYRSPEDDLDV
jgi:hypothetical protein